MKRTIAYGAAAVQGDWPVQEDGFLVDPVAGFFALADGFGGAGSGDQAVRAAIQEARMKGRELAPRAESLAAALKEWNNKLDDWNKPRGPARRGACSMLIGKIESSGRAVLVNVGAIAVLLLRSGSMHTLLAPQCAPREYPGAPLLPEQALGLGAEVFPEHRTLQLISGDVLLAASGGLAWDNEAFQLDLLGHVGLRTPGESLATLAAQLGENHPAGGGSGWNRSILLLEAP